MAAEVADLVIKVRREGVTEATAELKGLGNAADDSGQEAFTASVSWDALKGVIEAAGEAAAKSAIDYITQGKAMNYAKEQANDLSKALGEQGLMRSGGFFAGGPPGGGFKTDLGSAFRSASNFASSLLTTLTTISPVVGVIVSGVIGLLSPLVAAAAAAVVLGTALGVVGAGMVAVSVKWRSLLSDTNDGIDHMRGAVLAIEAELFNVAKEAMTAFGSTGGGPNPFEAFAKVTVKAIEMVEPYILKVADWIGNFVDGLSEVPGRVSPIVQWFHTWIDEWKVLLDIVNEGVKGGGGLIAFLNKYEAPAKAFVEGIAQVINGLRKAVAMGFGLNMDQLAEFIRNVFDAISQLMPGWLAFSNALAQVGLQLSRLVLAFAPIINQAAIFGAAILEHVVAPLVQGVLWALEQLMKVPLLRWLVELGGGFAIVALGVSRLSFGLLSFGKLITGQYLVSLIRFIQTVKQMGGPMQAFASFFPRLAPLVGALMNNFQNLGQSMAGVFGKTLSAGTATMLGAAASVAALIVVTIVLDRAMAAYNETQKAINAEWDKTIQLMAEGAISIEQAQQSMVQLGVQSVGTQSNLSKLGYGLTHLKETGAGVVGMLTSQIPLVGQWTERWAGNMVIADQTAEANKRMTEAFDEQSKNLVGVIQNTGSLTDAQVNYLNVMKDSAQGVGAYNDFLTQTKALYDTHQITLGQYEAVLNQLGITWTQAGEQGSLAALKLEGASNTIAQALNDLDKATSGSTKGWNSFAEATGQSAQQMRNDALAAINDTAGGILGSGQKITEFLQKQSDAIDSWKTNLADSVNFVNQAWSTLAQDASLTNQKIIETLDNAVRETAKLTDNLKTVVSKGLSKEAMTQIFTLPGEQQAALFGQLATMSRKQIQHVNADVKKGGNLAAGYADTAAGAIDLSMQKVATALELLVSKQLGIPFRQIQQRVNRLVGDVNKKTGQLKSRKVKIDVEFAQAHAARLKQALDRDTGGGAAINFPVPNLSAVHTAYQNAGNEAGKGFADGAQQSADTAAKAVTDVGDKAVKAASQSASPAKMNKVGRDAVKGVVDGVKGQAGALVSSMSNVGTQMGAGFRQGLNEQMQLARQDAVAAAQQIAQDVRNASQQRSPSKVFYKIGQNMGLGMRLGFKDSMDGMTRDVRTGQRRLQTGWNLGGRRRGQNINGRLRFDWRRGSADLDGAMAWEARNTL